MANKISPYALAYHLAGVMDGDWDDGIERFVAASAAPGTSDVITVKLETETGEKQEFKLTISEVLR